MKLTSINNLNIDEWSKFVFNHPHGNIFQTPEMYEVFKRTKNYSPIFLAVIDDNNIIGILLSVIQQEFSGLLKGLSSRCVSWGGPLIKNDLNIKQKMEVLDFILKEQNKTVKKKAIYMEFRNQWDNQIFKKIYETNQYIYEEEFNIQIDLTQNIDRLLASLSQSKRRALRKAKGKNVQIVETTDINLLKDFYNLLYEFYDLHIKKPLADWTFFLALNQVLLRKNMVKFFMVLHEEKLIGGIISPFYKGILYEWYVYGNRKYSKLFPSEMATWAPIEWGSKNNCRLFDFMGAGKPNEKYGVRDFKVQFGGTQVKFGRYINTFKKTKMKIAQMGLKIIKNVK
jgi:lipid II:glycine glycyltransferase (peptidoglycan interpeptide bridge formation enzyme)